MAGHLNKQTVKNYSSFIGGSTRCLNHVAVMDLVIPGLKDLTLAGDKTEWKVLESERKDAFSWYTKRKLWEISQDKLDKMATNYSDEEDDFIDL